MCKSHRSHQDAIRVAAQLGARFRFRRTRAGLAAAKAAQSFYEFAPKLLIISVFF